MGDPAARDHAQAKLQEAGRWWAAFDFAVREARRWRLLYATRRYRLSQELVKGGASSSDRLLFFQERVTEAYDRCLCAMESIGVTSETARAAEMMARIYFEEFEEREHELIPRPQRFDHG